MRLTLADNTGELSCRP